MSFKDDNLTPSASNPTYDNGLTEDQMQSGRSWLPNDPHFKEDIENEKEPNEGEELIEGIELHCLRCSIKFPHQYETPKTWHEYLEDKGNWRCKQCDDLYIINPIPQKQNQESRKRSFYTLEEWQRLAIDRYNQLKKTILDNIPPIWPAMELVLSVKSILYIKDCSLPMIMILLGAPSSLKTATLQMLRKTPHDTIYTDNFTAKSFVSHNSGVKEEQLKEMDLLPRIKNKLFLAPEMASIFGKKEEDLQEVLSIFTRIADGHGLESDSGACGRRGYTGQYMFAMIGVAVDVPHKVFKLLGYLGPKLHFFRLSRLIKNEDDLLKSLKEDAYHIKFERIEKSLNDYLNTFQMGPFVTVKDKDVVGNELILKKMEWDTKRDSTNDNDYSLRVLVKCGMLLAHLRAVVQTWNPRNHQSLDYAYATPLIEEPSRAIEQLRNLARGHALSQGRNYITQQDLSIPIKVVLSTASIERVNLFDLLLAHKGRLTTSTITMSLNVSSDTVIRTMDELKATGLVEFVNKPNQTAEKEIKLKEEFNWFLTEEFAKLREGFVPTDNREYLKKETDSDSDSSFRTNLPPSHTDRRFRI